MTAAGLAVAALLVSGVVGELPYFDRLQPHLLTTHLDAYRYVFDATINHAELTRSVLYLAGYTLALLIIALLVFDRRDVTC
jgi:ABC-type transport system involved in multi-copper enzyme maturation permease subunit